VIVTGGQSHAANALGRILPFEPHRNNVTVYRGQCYATSNPVLGATGVAESLWTRFGNRLTEETGRPVVFINGAVAGSQVSDWLDDRSGYRLRLVTTIREARELGYEPDLVIWIQGETDAAVGIAPEEFATSLARLSAVIEKESGMAGTAPWMFLRSTFCRTMPENGPQLEAALESMTARPNDRLVLGPSLTKFPVELRHDECHLNGEGAALLIEDMVNSVDDILFPASDHETN
jgi:DNA-directed RNA polymerase subunit K/omega